MNNEEVTVWLRQGEGEEELYMSITMPREVADLMGKIRGENPEMWENKDLDLYEEAHRRLEEDQCAESVIEKHGGDKHRTPDERQSQLTTKKYQKDKPRQWWRWLLFIPAGVAILLIGGIVVNILGYLETGRLGLDYPIVQFFSISVPMIMAIAFAIFAASRVAPSARIGGIIFSSLLLVFYAAVLAIIIFGVTITHIESVTWVTYATLVLDIATCIVMMIWIVNNEFE